MALKSGVLLYKIHGREIHVLLIKDEEGGWQIPHGEAGQRDSIERVARDALKHKAGTDAPVAFEYMLSVDLGGNDQLFCYVAQYKGSERPEAGEGAMQADWLSLDRAGQLVDERELAALELLRGKATRVA